MASTCHGELAQIIFSRIEERTDEREERREKREERREREKGKNRTEKRAERRRRWKRWKRSRRKRKEEEEVNANKPQNIWIWEHAFGQDVRSHFCLFLGVGEGEYAS